MRQAGEEFTYGRLSSGQQVSNVAYPQGYPGKLIRIRSTMAWGLEARVPFLDKAFLEVAMNVDAKEKMFNKGVDQEFDADGCPKMEKVRKFMATWSHGQHKHGPHLLPPGSQYILRKAFDCSPDGKVGRPSPHSQYCHVFSRLMLRVF